MLRKWMGIGLFAAAGSVVVVVGTAACGTDAIGIDTCRQVEEARCRQAPHCTDFDPNQHLDLSLPVHRNSPTTDVDACIRYYHDACLHGLATNVEPGAPATKACVDAINTGDCQTVVHPDSNAACAWLRPPDVPEAGADAYADAYADAADGADTATQ